MKQRGGGDNVSRRLGGRERGGRNSRKAVIEVHNSVHCVVHRDEPETSATPLDKSMPGVQ
jgi:hypothetical protein